MKPKCSWKSFYSTLHMTLECRDTKLWPISRCIRMSLLSTKSNTRIRLVCWRITHTRHSSTYCSVIDQWSLRILLVDCTIFLTWDVPWISETKNSIAWRSWSQNTFIPFVCRVLPSAAKLTKKPAHMQKKLSWKTFFQFAGGNIPRHFHYRYGLQLHNLCNKSINPVSK